MKYFFYEVGHMAWKTAKFCFWVGVYSVAAGTAAHLIQMAVLYGWRLV
jgi:hypothetical protein